MQTAAWSWAWGSLAKFGGMRLVKQDARRIGGDRRAGRNGARVRRDILLAIVVAVSVCSALMVPQHAYSELTFTGYSNGTSTQAGGSAGSGGSSSQTTNSTAQGGTGSSSGTSSNTVTNSTTTSSGTSGNVTNSTTTTQSNSTSYSGANSTSSSLNSSTGSNNTSTSGTNSTSNMAGTTGASTSNSTKSGTSGTTNSTSAGSGTSSTSSSNSTNSTSPSSSSTNSTSEDQSSGQSESSSTSESQPTSEGESSGGSGISSSIVTSESTTSSETSQSNQSVVSPSIVISGVNGPVMTTNSSTTTYSQGTILPSGLFLTNDQQYYAYGDVVTLKAALPGMSLQNVAFVVADPTGNDIVSRTVTTDSNGSAELQFKIPSNFETGVYQDIATALVDGKNYTNSTEFNVIKTHGISIDSVQLVDQQGNPSSMIKQGQNNFVQVSVSSGETMPVLFTVNLFDANQSSIGTASIKSTVKPGDTQMTLSFFIPPTAQMGRSDIFTDAFSDWPANGGTPLTTESCLSASLENPAALPVSYQPSAPKSCTDQRPQNLNGTTLVGTQSPMTNNQATAVLGVAVQNDSMTFMDPTQARLLALAYKNGTAPNAGDKSIDLVSLNLNALNSTIQANNTSQAAITNFTTLLGPALQNDPMAQKIMQEIQVSKQRVANIIGNETAAKVNDELIQKQRVAAASQLKQDLTALAQTNLATTPSAAFSSFLSSVPDNRTQAVFQGEFNFMQQRVQAANAAMQNVLQNGGSLDQAVQTFDSYAAVNHAQIVQINQDLNVQYGLADSNVQSCFDANGDLTMVNGTNPCIANLENNSTNSSGISIVSVQPTDQNGNPVSLFTRGQGGFVRVTLHSSYQVPTLVTVNLFDSNLDTLGTSSAKYTLSPGDSEVVLPYYVPQQATPGLASIYSDILTDWPNKGGTSQSHELSYFVGLS